MTETSPNGSVSTAVAQQDRSVVNLVPQYRVEFAELLPAHVKADTFIRLAVGALRKNPQLKTAAENDPASLIFALREAARLGHEPGTEAFYLVPMGGKVEGWEGYRGVIERMYRAGAISSVKAEVVHGNDVFHFTPDMDRPQHEVDWFGDRGPILGAYAYAVMRDGSTSKVIVVNQSYLAKVRAMSRGSDKPTSPWVKWEEAMVLKTVVHRLEPFVPTSSEYLREQLRAAADVQAEKGAPAVSAADVPADPDGVDVTTGVIDAEVVPDIDVLWQEIDIAATDMPADFDVDSDFLRWSNGVTTDAATPRQVEDYLRDLRGRIPTKA
jgi:recombination protein RecT